RNAGEEEHCAIERHGPRGELVLSYPAGYEWGEREPEKQVEVRPERTRIDHPDRLEQMMMVAPIDSEEDEAQGVTHKFRHERAEPRQRGALWNLQPKDHDGDEDGDDTIAERFHSSLGHVRLRSCCRNVKQKTA